MTEKVEKKVRIDDVEYILRAETENDNLVELYLAKYIYPLPGYGNNVHTVIEVYENKAEIYRVNVNWNGTGIKMYNEIVSKKTIQRLMKIANEYLHQLTTNNENDKEKTYNTLKDMFNEMYYVFENAKNKQT